MEGGGISLKKGCVKGRCKVIKSFVGEEEIYWIVGQGISEGVVSGVSAGE